MIAISASEVHEHMLKLVALSKITEELCNLDDLSNFNNLHSEFMKLKIPFDCVSEGDKIYFPTTGMKY
jgi:hypothetical protein